MRDIRTVGCVGCGLMGSGIAQVCAASGYTTIVREVDETVLEAGLGRIRKFLDEGVEQGQGHRGGARRDARQPVGNHGHSTRWRLATS